MSLHPYIVLNVEANTNPDIEWLRLGTAAHTVNDSDARRYYEESLRLNPQNVVATQNLAVLHVQNNRFHEGMLAIERAVLMEPMSDSIRVNHALMLFEAERIGEALEEARRAVAIKPSTVTRMVLALMLDAAGHPQDAFNTYNEILRDDPRHSAAAANACFVQSLTDATSADLQAQRNLWRKSSACLSPRATHDNDRSPERPLRVGYVGGDFKTHSAALIFGNVILHHDPTNVEVFIYSTLPVNPENSMTKRFLDKAGKNWRDVSKISDDAFTTLIHQDKIDILVDLAAHSKGGRLAVFTRKPAPVQVTAWGMAIGTGCPEIDYYFADPVLIPEHERQFFAEQIYDLPSVVSFLPPVEYGFAGKSMAPCYQHERFTLGYFGRCTKLSDELLATYREILLRLPGARMLFKDQAFRRPYSIQRVLNALPDIDPKRLLFSISSTHRDHMLSYQQADIILDPFPHSGGAASLEQLYMGVPVVALYGKQPSGRLTASILTALGRTEWIAKTKEEYVDIVIKLIENPEKLLAARYTLHDELMNSPMVVDYVKRVEESYRSMWKTWINK